MTFLAFGLLLFSCANFYGQYKAKDSFRKTVYIVADCFIFIGAFVELFKLGWL